MRRDEWPRVAIAFGWFFFVLGSYYMIRPVRETMATVVDRNLRAHLFTGTFVVSLVVIPLFGWCATRFPRRRLVPIVYRGFTIWLLGFAFLFSQQAPTAWTAGLFYVWVSVFNLFVVSVFWSVLADEFDSEQGKRLFGPLAAGGSLGGLLGSLVIPALMERWGVGGALCVPFVGMELALWCHRRFERLSHSGGQRQLPVGDGGSDPSLRRRGVWAGLMRCVTSPYLSAICLFLMLGKWCATAVYLLYVESVNQEVAALADRTALFARENLYVQLATLVFQLVLTTQILARLGMTVALAIVPFGLAAAFVSIGTWFGLTTLFWVQVGQRSLGYGLLGPAGQNLFTVVPRADKYQAKNAIDTAIFRGGDVVSAWAHQGLSQFLSDARIAWFMAPVAMVWGLVGGYLGSQHRQRAAHARRDEHSDP